jgi:hypothetical protein
MQIEVANTLARGKPAIAHQWIDCTIVGAP